MNYLGVNTITLDSAHIADLSTGTVPYSFPVSAGDAGQVMVTDGNGNLTFESATVQPPSHATGFFQDVSGARKCQSPHSESSTTAFTRGLSWNRVVLRKSLPGCCKILQQPGRSGTS